MGLSELDIRVPKEGWGVDNTIVPSKLEWVRAAQHSMSELEQVSRASVVWEGEVWGPRGCLCQLKPEQREKGTLGGHCLA